MTTYTLKLLVPYSLTDRQHGRTLVRSLTDYFPHHVPTVFGKSEPLRDRFDAGALDSVLNSWGALNFLATREDPVLRVNVHFWPTPSRNPQHSSISIIRLESDRSEDANRICQFLYSTCEAFRPDVAVAHILTRTEMEKHVEALRRQPSVRPDLADRSAENMKWRAQKEGYASVLWGVTMANLNTAQLRKCLPTIYWVTVFGPSYIEMFGEEKILTTPAHEIHRLPSGAIAIQLSASIEDNPRGWQDFESARGRAIEHLDSNVFFDASFPKNHIYNTPYFGEPQVQLGEKRKPIITTVGGISTKRAILSAIDRRKEP